MRINAINLDYRPLNELLRQGEGENFEVVGCCGQRFLAAGMSKRTISIEGVPGNALGRLSQWRGNRGQRQCTGCGWRHHE